MRLCAIDQLFDPVDPSPFRQQDLSAWAAEYIVESMNEMSVPEPVTLKIVVAGPVDPNSETATGVAVRAYFARQAALRRRSLRLLLRRGLVTLAIGITFLVVFFSVSHLIAWLLDNGPFATLLREGSLIVGWVAMWRPIEIFLYDWWPIVGDRQLHERLSGTSVVVVGLAVAAAKVEVRASANLSAKRSIARWENEGGRIKRR